MTVHVRAVGLVLAALLAFGSTLALAPSAAAVPGLPDCKEAPVVYSPSDASLAQWLDPATGTGSSGRRPFDVTPPRIYSGYGYAGFQWSTYDLGCAGALSSFDSLTATADTATGNRLLGLAVAQAALTNGIHRRLADLSSFMAPLDDVVGDTASALRDAVYRPWIGGALAVVVVVMLALASVGQLSGTLRAAAWALAVLTVTMGVLNFPVRAAQFFDETVSDSLETVNAAAAGFSTQRDDEADPSQAQGSLLVDRVLFDSWVRGQFGTTSGAAVDRYARTLWEAHTLTYDEERTYRAGGPAARALVERKNDRWTETMERIAEDDPSLYQQLQGKKGGRVGVGAMTLVSTSAIGLFRMVADTYTLLGMVVIRLLVMFAPLIGVLGVVVTFGGVVRWAGNMLGAAVINTVAFSLGALVHTVATNALVNGSGGGLEFGRLLLAALLTLGLLVVCWPLLSLRRIAGHDHRPGAGLLAKGGRMARSYVVTRTATAAGVREVAEHDDPERQPVAPRGPRPSRSGSGGETSRPEALPRPQPVRSDRGLTSTATRPALPPAPTPAPVAASGPPRPLPPARGVASSAPTTVVGEAVYAYAPAGWDVTPERTGRVRLSDVEAREANRRRVTDGGLYVPGSAPRAVLHGRVVHGDALAAGDLHDSNRRNGDRPGVLYVYDPESGRDVPLSGVGSHGSRRPLVAGEPAR